ncbi:IS5/IS1182 family transposase [Streptomyces nodosus]|uniref:Transposase n=1 Tax=Streptomyces nodosus TaxID=40318 RepID=A0A0B5DJU4_9ACTN|nr:transposase [Streptomyces nodosus]QEV42449.1 IS5/IS1182 family transposase [Streptomyces nodosus]
MAMVERLVPDALWELFQQVVPAAPVRRQGGGRRRYGDRQVLAAIVFVAKTGCTWRRLPSGFGPSGSTAHRRFTEWSRARVWGKLHRQVLDELGARGGLDWSRCAIDSVNMRPSKGDLTGPDPVDRVAWLSGCRRLHRRYERKADHFLAFSGIAAALICYRRLTA